jgi:hypothetical protein
VSFDFDNTIFLLEKDPEDDFSYKFDPKDPDIPLGKINEKIVDLILKYKSDGYKVICVTSRMAKYKKQVEDVIRENRLPISEIYCTNGQDKANTLKRLGVIKHYDDDMFEIIGLKNSGIEGVLV